MKKVSNFKVYFILSVVVMFCLGISTGTWLWWVSRMNMMVALLIAAYREDCKTNKE